jgi:hypothetical protein
MAPEFLFYLTLAHVFLLSSGLLHSLAMLHYALTEQGVALPFHRFTKRRFATPSLYLTVLY